jgi:hypothetical protein
VATVHRHSLTPSTSPQPPPTPYEAMVAPPEYMNNRNIFQQNAPFVILYYLITNFGKLYIGLLILLIPY